LSVHYIYPIHRELSFTKIAENHIAYLSNHVKVQKIDEDILDVMHWSGGKKILLHPILYTTIGDRADMFKQRIKRLEKLLKVKDKLGGFETCDSNQISQIAVKVLNQLDLIFVPSRWAKQSFITCGVKTPIEILPHGISKHYLAPPTKKPSSNLKWLYDFKRKHKAILILYFLHHSGYRKGADIVAKAMRLVQEEHPKAYLLVKRGSIQDPYLKLLRQLKTLELAGWLTEEELVQLYDLCDILIVPSRSGGFELNALEGLARGIPTITPRHGCFLDYIDYVIPCEIEGTAKIFKNNPIHIGEGFNPSWRGLAKKIKNTIRRLQAHKNKALKNAERIRSLYQWENIGDALITVLREEKFV